MIIDFTDIFFYIFFFIIYSFCGWIIEVIYRSINQRKLINAGFLYGPFLPIYGLGAIFIVFLEFIFQEWHIVFRLLIFGSALTILEYIGGISTEKIFKLKLWDYSGTKFNFQGKVSLLFSTLWMIMAFIFITFIHPHLLQYIDTIDRTFVKSITIVISFYMVIDFTFSVVSLKAFRRKIIYLYSEYFNLSNKEIVNIFDSLKRLRNAFPDLNKYINININNEIKNKVDAFLRSVQDKIPDLKKRDRMTFEQEYLHITRDISEHDEFMKLKRFSHHNNSIYEHVHDVAYLSYQICRFLKLDYRSATRGALLHDFFLYDWRNHDVPDLSRGKFHGIEHPKIAFDNAQKYFSLNEIEQDIIIKHMWPLTITPPKYKETFIVSFIDKYLASKEFIDGFKNNKNNRCH